MTPLALRSLGSSRQLEIEWRDGRVDRVPYRRLRAQCPCAACRQRRRGGPIESANAVALVGIVPFGPNAVLLEFSDGHARGIFPFAYLLELSRGEYAAAE